jgi:hypothetical protein
MALELYSISLKTVNGLSTRDLIYKSSIVNNWHLGTLRNLRLRIFIDGSTQPVELPTSNSINVCLKILHVCQ